VFLAATLLAMTPGTSLLTCLKIMKVDHVPDGIKAASPAVPVETVWLAAVLDDGIGDALLASPLLETLFDDLERCEIDVFHPQPEVARFVFSNARFVRGVFAADQLPGVENQYDLSVRTSRSARFNVRDPAKLQRVCPGFVERVLGGTGLARAREFFLAPDPTAYGALAAHVGCGVRYVTLHTGFDDTASWSQEHWTRVAADLRVRFPDLRLVQLGADESPRIPGMDVDLVGRATLDETAWFLKHAALHVDAGSGLAHLARAVHTPGIVLFRPPEAEACGHACNTNLAAPSLANCREATPDWLSLCSWGIAGRECMTSIAPEAVVEHAIRQLEAVESLRAHAGPVACYDGALCTADYSQLVRLCITLELPLLPISQHIQNDRTGVYIHASKQWEYLYALRGISQAYGFDAQGLRIADVGGGRGALGPYLAHLGHRVETFDLDYLWVHGADPTVELRFRRWAREVGLRARFGSLYNVPAPSGAYDVVTCISVVEHVPFKEYVLLEALRILRPGGLLVLTFDFATTPEPFEGGTRREIFSPERLASTLQWLGIPATPVDPEEVKRSAGRAYADCVCGLPEGMSVAGMLIRKGGE
jgi:SAM-dependent methyltransferase